MESSAASRWVIADANIRMARDYPLGAGYRGNETLSAYYIPPEFLTAETSTRSAHNTFLAILVDQGIPGAILFVLLIIWGGIRLTALLFMDRHGLPSELGGLRAMIGSSLAALLVSGQFVNALRLEVAIWLIAMLAALDVLCRQWREKHASSTQATEMETRAKAVAPVRRAVRPVPHARVS
jgi:O-antigen ligase